MKLEIKTNTKMKINKIMDGIIFNKDTTFVSELIQNSQRANAKYINFDIYKNRIVVRDNGCSLKDPDNLLTLDYSDWDSTDEGFGVGFWSVLVIPNLDEISVKSGYHNITIPVHTAKEDLQVLYEKLINEHKGFEVSFYGDFNTDYLDEVKEEIKEVGKFIDINISIDNEPIKKENLLEVCDNSIYSIDFNNKLFKGRLAPVEYSNDICVYYEGRLVTNLKNFNYVQGVIILKSGAVNLKEPDRKAFIEDDKYHIFIEKLENYIKSLYKSFIKEKSSNLQGFFHRFQNGILQYCKAKDYENYLMVDSLIEENFEMNTDTLKELVYKADVSENEIVSILNRCTEAYDYVWNKLDKDKEIDSNGNLKDIELLEEDLIIDFRYLESITINGNTYERKLNLNRMDISKEEYHNETNRTYNSNECTTKTTVKEFVSKFKNIAWINGFDKSSFKNEIALLEYYGINVIVADNYMYKNYFSEKGVPYVEDLIKNINEETSINNLTCKTMKEKIFLNILEPICIRYSLPKDTFLIGDIKKNININYNGKTLSKIKLQNKNSEDIKVYGIQSKDKIILDRKAINLKMFNLNHTDNYIGINELKAIMFNLNTIAHELSHLLYKTTDNTDLHSKMEKKITEEIINVYI